MNNPNTSPSISPKNRPHKRTVRSDDDKAVRPDWLKLLLIGLTLCSFGAAMVLPFQDGVLGWYAIITFLGHPSTIGFWFFPLATLLFLRVFGTLHRAKLLILKALLALILMIVAVVALRGSDFHSNIGVGVFFWLVAGYLLFATTIRMRYPDGGLKFASAGIVLSLACMVWAQHANSQRKIHAVWHTADAIVGNTSDDSQHAELGAVLPPANGGGTPNKASNQATIAKPLLNIPFTPSSQIALKRDFDLHNPWSQPNATVSCETALKRRYPVLLPPRFLEDKYEWLNFEHGDHICNNLLYVGTPNSSQGDFNYKITQDQRSNIYLVLGDRKDHALFSETFPMSREDNGLKNNDYVKKLNSVFVKLVDDNAIPMMDNEYTFTKAPAPTSPDILSKGCELKPLNRPNLYQWLSGRVDFRGQSIEKVSSFCSKNYAAIAHLSHDDTQENKVFENILHVKLFRSQDLRPVECGAVGIPLTKQQASHIYSNQLHIEQLSFTPDTATGCLNISVKLDNGTVL